MSKIIRGKKIAEKILTKLTLKTAKLKTRGIHPKLRVVLVGNDPASKIYVSKKGEAAQKIGVDFKLYRFKNNISNKKLLENINKIQKEIDYGGIIVQLPLPKTLDENAILNSIRPEFDVDCLTKINLDKLPTKNYKIVPPTPGAVLEILKQNKVSLKNKTVVLVGYGKLVGKPLDALLKNIGVKTIVCNSKTKNLKKECLKGDVLITGVGKKHLITADMLKENAIVIDAGVVLKNGKMYGDVDYKKAIKKVKYITPTPGGVGYITVAKLLENVIILAKKK